MNKKDWKPSTILSKIGWARFHYATDNFGNRIPMHEFATRIVDNKLDTLGGCCMAGAMEVSVILGAIGTGQENAMRRKFLKIGTTLSSWNDRVCPDADTAISQMRELEKGVIEFDFSLFVL